MAESVYEQVQDLLIETSQIQPMISLMPVPTCQCQLSCSLACQDAGTAFSATPSRQGALCAHWYSLWIYCGFQSGTAEAQISCVRILFQCPRHRLTRATCRFARVSPYSLLRSETSCFRRRTWAKACKGSCPDGYLGLSIPCSCVEETVRTGVAQGLEKRWEETQGTEKAAPDYWCTAV